MRQVRHQALGADAELRVHEVPEPEVGPGELILDVVCAGVTLPVVRQALGRGDAPGGDVAGRVTAVGPGVTGWAVGDRAAGLAGSGAYAERAVVRAAMSAPVPAGVDDATALSLVRAGQVALGVLTASGLRAGESVLVTAAAGGVGHLAVQLARVRGADRVVAAVGSSAKAEFVQALGADKVTTYADAARCGPVDVVLDGAGGEAFRPALEALAPFGRLVTFNGVGGPLDANELRMRGIAVIGFTMQHLFGRRPDQYEAQRAELWDLVLAGRLSAKVHATLPLEEAAEAHRMVGDRENLGRVVLEP